MKAWRDFSLFFLLASLALPLLAATADAGQEAYISAQLGGLPNTTSLQLKAGEQSFPALYSSSSAAKPQGAVILLHGMGQHMNWPQVIRPLREGLPEKGWDTLSLQMPLLSASASKASYGGTLADAARRIQAAYEFLAAEKKRLNIVVIGHGLGAASAIRHIAAQEQTPIVALAVISMANWQWLIPALDITAEMGKLRLPLVDIFAGNDRREVLTAIGLRAPLLRSNKELAYRQIVLPGADPYFSGYEKILLKRVVGWLTVVAPAAEVKAGSDSQEKPE